MISDLYPVRSRGRALAVLGAAQSMGVGLGVFLGGWLSDRFDWRTSFLIVGLPGIALAGVFLLTTREPARGQADQVTDSGETPTLETTLRTLWAFPSYRCAMLITAIGGFYGYGLLNWGPTFLRRAHEMTGTNVGIWFGMVVALGLACGNLISGMLGDWLGRRDVRTYMWIAAAGQILALPFGLLFLLAPSWQISIMGLAAYMVLYTMHSPVCFIVGQMLAPLRMRAMASVILTFGSGLMGLMVAPFVIGALNDALAAQFGLNAVRYSLTLVLCFLVAGVGAALLGTRWIRADLAVAEQSRT
jgi:MFS family permease